MTRSRSSFVAVSSILAFVVVLSGCAAQNWGIRPDEPSFTNLSTCAHYKTYTEYAQKLQEAYHTRATQNRGWIYVAAILGLAVAGVSGGLAAATGVSASTLGVLAIGGGFASGTFATINNDALAVSYTVAANRVDDALAKSRDIILTPSGDDKVQCTLALKSLVDNVSRARIQLEVARTDNAAGALARALDQRTLLNNQINAALQNGYSSSKK